NLFQWITLPLLALLLLADLVAMLRRAPARRVRLFRSVVWAAAMVAIAQPELPQELAVAIGIGRGTDLVLYLFVLAFLFASFAFYARSLRLQRQLTEVVRHLAVSEARRGGAARQPAPRDVE
ncbi:MAG: DUF2304 domain-containing protein, partial [Gemmataceae bacterium]|nr:DUF2304 domain-containing protein [Gemmataceae bacterium]